MAKKTKKSSLIENEIIEAPIQAQLITDTIEKNYYAHNVGHIVFLDSFGDYLLLNGGVYYFFGFFRILGFFSHEITVLFDLC